MYVQISAEGILSLQDADNFKGFSIKEADSNQGSAANALTAIGEPAESNHYWLDAESVVALSPRKDDQSWVDAFWDMLRKAEPYGFSDLESKRVKAHVETQ